MTYRQAPHGLQTQPSGCHTAREPLRTEWGTVPRFNRGVIRHIYDPLEGRLISFLSGRSPIYALQGRLFVQKSKNMTTAGLEPATFWCHSAIEAKRATIAPGSHNIKAKTVLHCLGVSVRHDLKCNSKYQIQMCSSYKKWMYKMIIIPALLVRN